MCVTWSHTISFPISGVSFFCWLCSSSDEVVVTYIIDNAPGDEQNVAADRGREFISLFLDVPAFYCYLQ